MHCLFRCLFTFDVHRLRRSTERERERKLVVEYPGTEHIQVVQAAGIPEWQVYLGPGYTRRAGYTPASIIWVYPDPQMPGSRSAPGYTGKPGFGNTHAPGKDGFSGPRVYLQTRAYLGRTWMPGPGPASRVYRVPGIPDTRTGSRVNSAGVSRSLKVLDRRRNMPKSDQNRSESLCAGL